MTPGILIYDWDDIIFPLWVSTRPGLHVTYGLFYVYDLDVGRCYTLRSV